MQIDLTGLERINVIIIHDHTILSDSDLKVWVDEFRNMIKDGFGDYLIPGDDDEN